MPVSPVQLDGALFKAVRGSLGRGPAVPLARGLSHLGEHAAGWLVFGALGALLTTDRPRRRAWLRASASVALAHGSNIAVKRVVRRQRPRFDGLPPLVGTPSRLSFPSAHAASTAAAAAAFGPLTPRLPWRSVVTVMATSRVLLGVHYPADVLAGAALGTALGRNVGRTPPEQLEPPAPRGRPR